jgi:hypothetical protein
MKYRKMTENSNSVPDTEHEQIEAARHRLQAVAPSLRKRPRQDVVAVLGELLDRIRDVKSSWHATLVRDTAASSGFSVETVSAGLEIAMEHWDSRALAAMVANETQSARDNKERHLHGYAMTSVVLAGAIPMPNLLSSILPLLVGSPVIVKPSSHDPQTPGLIARCLVDIDSELGQCIEVVPFSSANLEAMSLFLSSPCVTASGSDETILQIRNRLSPSQCFVGYGHKFSVAVVHSSSLRQAHSLEQISHALSIDIALWDQLGCLSPAAIYVLGEDAETNHLILLEALSKQLAERATEWPRGEVTDRKRADIRRERDEAEMRAGVSGGPKLRHSEASDWTVIAEADSEWRPTPLHRFIRLYPARDATALSSTLQPLSPHLSSVAMAGFEPGSDYEERLIARFRQLGFSRVCGPGRLQAPPLAWRHDGRALLTPLTRSPEIDAPH